MSKSVVFQQDFPTSSWEDHFFQPGIHYVSPPRSLDDRVIQKALDLVFDDDELLGEMFANMTRLSPEFARVMANDDEFLACFTHRTVAVWNFLLTFDTAAEFGDSTNLAFLMDLSEYREKMPFSHDEVLNNCDC